MEIPKNYSDVIDVWRAEDSTMGDKANNTIHYLLQDIIDSSNKDEFSKSPLTYTGSPFEPAFSFSSADLRYTIAPAPQSISNHGRLQHSLKLLDGLRVGAIDPCLLEKLESIQSKGKVTYGAQIGVRHTVEKDVYKLYVELPTEARAESEILAKELLGSDPVLQEESRNAFPTLFGINLQTQEKEIYYRVENLHPQEIKTILSRSQDKERFDDVLALLNETQNTPIKHFLPGNTWGYSYSVNLEKKITCSIYTFAKTLFGPDGWVREKVLKMGERQSWNIDSYKRISEPLVGNRDTMHHGIFGIVIPHKRPAAAWIGIAPIEPQYV